MLKGPLLLLLWLCAALTYAQTFPQAPEKAEFITSDIPRFWVAFDQVQAGKPGNPFVQYLSAGTKGVKGFTPNRIISADSLLSAARRKKQDYLKARSGSLEILTKEKQCRAAFYALEYWYPAAVFPPVYVVVGRFNSGGTVSADGLIIGAEKVNPDGLPYIVAHELIHFQQKIAYKDSSLLEQCIVEGSADFVGELISGQIATSAEAYTYGKAHEKALWQEFQGKMNKADFSDWLYGTSGKDKRPNDLGYWIGYQICQAYFNKAKDKKKALYDILNTKDCKLLLQQSGYADKFK